MEDDQLSLPYHASVEPGVWRYAKADRLSLLIDAEEYFERIQQSMLKAQEEILLLGWDFDTRIHLARGRRWYQRPFRRGYPARLGNFLVWLTRRRKTLDIKLLVWGLSFLQFCTRGSMALDMIRMAVRRQIQFKHDTNLPIGCAHHQKIAVLDRSTAFCGGIDLTRERWDTRAHHSVDPRRVSPWGRSYDPWHDLSTIMEGEVAEALCDIFQERWKNANGAPLKKVASTGHSCWPDNLPAQFSDVEVGIARSRPAYKDKPAINEVEDLFLRQIEAARQFIYIESQYLTSRTIVEAMAKRLQEEEPPEIVMVHPIEAESWIERQAMDDTRSWLAATLREVDHKKRFHLYVAYSDEVPVYIHSKLMIVDDCILRVGSANINNRSMGLDTECDVFIDCARAANEGAQAGIKMLRCDLLAEHCGLELAEAQSLFDAGKSMAAVIERHGSKGSRRLQLFDIPQLSEFSDYVAGSQIFDPEAPEDVFATYPKGGLYRPGSLLYRVREKIRKRKSPHEPV